MWSDHYELTANLLILSREYGKTFYRDYVGSIVLHSLLRTSKGNAPKYGAAALTDLAKTQSSNHVSHSLNFLHGAI